LTKEGFITWDYGPGIQDPECAGSISLASQTDENMGGFNVFLGLYRKLMIHGN